MHHRIQMISSLPTLLSTPFSSKCYQSYNGTARKKMPFLAMRFPVIPEMGVLIWILVSLHAALATEVTFRNHSCVPTGVPNLCFLNNLHYNPHDRHVIQVFPANPSHLRLGGEITTFKDFKFHHFDAKLYGMLGRPQILEVINLWVKTVELSRTVHHADFQRNLVELLAVEPGVDAPLLSYLDLSDNMLSNISNLNVLVNLEVLLLNNNNVKHIDPATMKNLTKLRHLELTHNYVHQFSTDVFPQSLTHLNLYSNELKSLNYGNLYFPALEILNVERTGLNSIDASAMVLAMPALKLVRIGGNSIDPNDFRLAVEQFRKHNVSSSGETDEVACLYSELEVDGVCVKLVRPRSAVREFWMTFAVVVVAIVMVLTVWRVFAAMNNERFIPDFRSRS